MQKREVSKRITLDGREFVINQFDPMTGTWVAYKLMSEFIPALPGLSKVLGAPLPVGGAAMSKADFMDLQRDCLRVCSEVLPSGNTPIVNLNGSWGVNDFTPRLALGLTVQVLVFNLTDFFDESLWSFLGEALQESGLPLPGAKQ